MVTVMDHACRCRPRRLPPLSPRVCVVTSILMEQVWRSRTCHKTLNRCRQCWSSTNAHTSTLCTTIMIGRRRRAQSAQTTPVVSNHAFALRRLAPHTVRAWQPRQPCGRSGAYHTDTHTRGRRAMAEDMDTLTPTPVVCRPKGGIATRRFQGGLRRPRQSAQD